jgi:hypothetical protein
MSFGNNCQEEIYAIYNFRFLKESQAYHAGKLPSAVHDTGKANFDEMTLRIQSISM